MNYENNIGYERFEIVQGWPPQNSYNKMKSYETNEGCGSCGQCGGGHCGR
jgi:hypothetical protein